MLLENDISTLVFYISALFFSMEVNMLWGNEISTPVFYISPLMVQKYKKIGVKYHFIFYIFAPMVRRYQENEWK
jgi:hypothetical protein